MGSRSRGVRFGYVVAVLAGLCVSSAGCGGAYDEGNPEPENTPRPEVGEPSRISFNAGTADITLELISDEGFCLLNQTTGVSVIIGDVRGRPVPDVDVSFYVERGRGLIDAEAKTGPDGTAEVTFRSLCTADPSDPITILVLARGNEPYSDLNSNGRFDGGESYLDKNGNGRYDGGEAYTDSNRNGRPDPNEPFRDANANGQLDGEAFADANNNGTLDGEPYIDLDVDAFLDADLDGLFDPAKDDFLAVDANGNRTFDAVGNGRYDGNALISEIALVIPVDSDGNRPATRTPTPGGPTSTPASVTPTPELTPTPVRTPVVTPTIAGPTHVSLLSVGSGDVTVEMFDDAGRCQQDVVRPIVAVVGDRLGAPLADVPITFFVETGRGLLPRQAITDEDGRASVNFRSLCPANAHENITIVAAVRGVEPFTDLNSNGVFDAGEPFTDLPNEAFLDGDDDGAFDPAAGDLLLWDPNGNGAFDPNGNGVWDADVIRSAKAVLLPRSPVPLPPDFALTGISQLSFSAGTDIEFEMFTEGGACIVNAVADVVVVAGDSAGRPAAPDAPIAFFSEIGRGTIPAQARTDADGVAQVAFRSLCGSSAAAEPITVTALTRGPEPYLDLNANDRFDGGESYFDRNRNFRYDGGEPYRDLNNNGRPDAGEPFRDWNDNGRLDGDAFADANDNGVLDGEPYIDLPREAFLDADGDGRYDPFVGDRLLFDTNDNQTYDDGGNGRYDTDNVIVASVVMVPHREEDGGPAQDPLGSLPTGAAQLFVAADPGSILVVSEAGVCSPVTATISAAPTDALGRVLNPGTPVAFFVEAGRGSVQGAALVGTNGSADAQFHSLCPQDLNNPIDVAAAVVTREPFDDVNGNGRWDAGEPFTDLPSEAFLDGNGNNLYEPQLGEFLIADADGDGQYDPGSNGTYDARVVLVGKTVIVPRSAEAPPTEPLREPTDVSRLNFSAQAEDVRLNLFDEFGRCRSGVTANIVALAGDSQGNALAGVRVGFFVAPGRGVVSQSAVTTVDGVATGTIVASCPPNAAEPITVVAAVRGKEPFTDLNGNRVYDAGEPFVDLPRDAFLDVDRDGVFEPSLGDFLVWDANQNGQYDAAGNGVYDTDNILTSETLLIPFRNGMPAAGVLSTRTAVSRLGFTSFAGSSEPVGVREYELVMFGADGRCRVNVSPTQIKVLAGDLRGRPVPPETAIALFVESGRAVLAESVRTDDEGLALATFHNLCPADADQPITVVAAVRGMESFTDLNSNGVYDVGEPFLDEPIEIFLDGNDNGIFEPLAGEFLIHDANRNGLYDRGPSPTGGNGVYDADVVLADVAHVIPTDSAGQRMSDPLAPAFKRPMSIEATPDDVTMTSVSPDGTCDANASAVLTTLVTDLRDRPVNPAARVHFYVEQGRGSVAGASYTAGDGRAQVLLRNKCTANFKEPITVVAVTVGSEPYVDLNSNQRYDTGEPFTDLPNEIFLDGNDNGVYEPQSGEFLVRDLDGDGLYDAGGNGTYDANTVLSVTFRVQPIGTELVPEDAFREARGVTSMSFQLGVDDVAYEIFDAAGRCQVDVPVSLTALAGDARGRALADVPIAFFAETGRGLVGPVAATDATGRAISTLRSLCPADAMDEITVVAATRGGEPFTDSNGNGRRDTNEAFVDLPPDVFLDGNRNGVFEPNLGDYLVYDEDGDGQYDAMLNGRYDNDRVVSSQAVLIPTRFGLPEFDILTKKTSLSSLSFGAGTEVRFEMFDENRNCIVNELGDIVVLAGDFAGRPVPPETAIGIFVERGRGVVVEQVLTGPEGDGQTQLHSLCPAGNAFTEPATQPITVVAAARGSEPFADLNNNRRHDLGEPFVDYPSEVFLDSDNDGVYEPQRGDYLIHDANGNGAYDPGSNGVYDADIVVAETLLLFPWIAGDRGPAADPLDLGPLPVAQIAITAEPQRLAMFDENGACITSETTDVSATPFDTSGAALEGFAMVSFFVEPTRGGMPTSAFIGVEGEARASFRPACPQGVDHEEPITIVAAMRGVEPFTDVNRNGRFDPSEPFTDLPDDAFLDADDDGAFSPGDLLIYDADGDGTYDGTGNGRYDFDRIVTAAVVIQPIKAEEPAPRPLVDVTSVSRLQLADTSVELVDESGSCIGGVEANVSAQAGNFRGSLAPEGQVVGFFIDGRRGLISESDLTDVQGGVGATLALACDVAAPLAPFAITLATLGPEPFSDLNRNGVRDEGEPYSDLPRDAFVDLDLDGSYTAGVDELLYDADGDGQYDGANGSYDAVNVIAARARVVPRQRGGTPTPTETALPTLTATPTAEPTHTATPPPSATPTVTDTATPEPTPTALPTSTATATSTESPVETPTPDATATP